MFHLSEVSSFDPVLKKFDASSLRVFSACASKSVKQNIFVDISNMCACATIARRPELAHGLGSSNDVSPDTVVISVLNVTGSSYSNAMPFGLTFS